MLLNHSRLFKVIENGAVRQIMYDLQLVLHCKYSIVCCILELFDVEEYRDLDIWVAQKPISKWLSAPPSAHVDALNDCGAPRERSQIVSSRPTLNPSKSVVVHFGTPRRLKYVSDLNCITIANTPISLSDKVIRT